MSRCVYLRQKDFAHGTYIIRKPGKYVLAEDIVFHPNPDDDFFPRPDQEEYSKGPFILGFFAAIVIAAKNVVLDLNGKTLKQSPEFALQQRFYANIEVTNTPFIKDQGPAHFGPETGSAEHAVIKNGTLGLSSHHGIHGNNVRDLYLKNLYITDFEVAAVAINGFHGLRICNVKAHHTRTDIPVNAMYSAGRFNHLLGRAWLAKHGDKLSAAVKTNYENALSALEAEMDEVLVAVKARKQVPAENLFANKIVNGQRILDGNNYGFLFSVPGIAIDDYVRSDTSLKRSSGLVMNNVSVKDIAAVVTEIICLNGPYGQEKDVSGALFHIQHACSEYEENGAPKPSAVYKGNVLTNAQLASAEAQHELNIPIGRTNLSSNLVAWSKGGTYQDLLNKGYDLMGNGDTMFHVQKGVHGIRIDGLKGGQLNNVRISKIANYGRLGTEACGQYRLSHPKQKLIGYNGAAAVGLNLAYSADIRGEDVQIRNIAADNGSARGIRLINVCDRIRIARALVDEVVSGGNGIGKTSMGKDTPFTAVMPNSIPCSYGIVVERFEDRKCTDIHFPCKNISNIRGVTNCSYDYAWKTVH